MKSRHSYLTKASEDFLKYVLLFYPIWIIAGWLTYNVEAIAIKDGLVPMQFNTAICFLFAGMYVVDRTLVPSLVFILIIAGITLAQDTFGINLNIDEALITHNYHTHTPHPGRMSPSTALAFILFSLTCLLKKRTGLYALLVITIPAIVGYMLFGMTGKYYDPFFTVMPGTTHIALNTSIMFTLIAIILLYKKK